MKLEGGNSYSSIHKTKKMQAGLMKATSLIHFPVKNLIKKFY